MANDFNPDPILMGGVPYHEKGGRVDGRIGGSEEVDFLPTTAEVRVTYSEGVGFFGRDGTFKKSKE